MSAVRHPFDGEQEPTRIVTGASPAKDGRAALLLSVAVVVGCAVALWIAGPFLSVHPQKNDPPKEEVTILYEPLAETGTGDTPITEAGRYRRTLDRLRLKRSR